MRNNQPVHDTEYLLRDDHFLISRTDSQGRIIYANPAFIEVSGFSREELVGAAHNIVRHPDMPQAAFEDLWRTLGRGEPWTGMVKNRRKDGGFYWVLANVTPITERGVTVCYASVRVKPSRAQVQAAEQAYARLRQGAARSVRLRGGQVQPTGVRAALARWRPEGVRARLLAWAALAASLFLGTAGAAVYGMRDTLTAQSLAIATALIAAGVAVILASGWHLARSITHQLAHAADFTRQIAAGNLSTALPGGAAQDDIGELAFSLEIMRKSLVSMALDVHAGIDHTFNGARDTADGDASPSGRSAGPAGQARRAQGAQLRQAIDVFRIAARPPRDLPVPPRRGPEKP